MIKVFARELLKIADDINSPQSMKIDVDYEQFSYKFTKLLMEYSNKGKYHVNVSFANYPVSMQDIEEYDIHDTIYLENYTTQHVLDFVNKFLDDLHGKGYYIRYKFHGKYGRHLIDVLTISWKDDTFAQVEKPSFFKNIINNITVKLL